MKRMSGLKLLDEREGTGTSAKKGNLVVYNTRIFLNQGKEVSHNDIQAKQLPKDMVRVEAGFTFIDHRIVLGRRQAICRSRACAHGYESRRLSESTHQPSSGLSR